MAKEQSNQTGAIASINRLTKSIVNLKSEHSEQAPRIRDSSTKLPVFS
ncbi:MAG: hypothetical protein K6T90_07990 [Leptolyngbyaceae cyanobacterium HOT.MB2.61]|nr:hypothetical protein [Leptolyngbyaceae cyanobacterium HOT.MB2.61]